MAENRRLYYLDNLRVVLTALVIAHHVGQAYGPTGGYWPIQESARAEVLGPFFTVNRSFFMSLLFMISGYFSVAAYNAKGPWPFLKSRLTRLGLPVLGFALLMIPLQLFVFTEPGQLGSAWPIDVGHLWFLEHLLIFSAGYVLWRVLRKGSAEPVPDKVAPPRTLTILAFALALAVLNGVVRIWSPIDTWFYPLGFIRIAYADVPRDLSFFIIGILAYRGQWFQRFPTKAGMAWLGVGLLAAAFWYAYDLGLATMLQLDDTVHDVLYLLWEMLLCCGMCIGLTVLFRERLNFQGGVSKVLAQSQYAAYIFHLFIVLGVQAVASLMPAPPLVKFVLVTVVSVPLTFWFSSWVRKPLHL